MPSPFPGIDPYIESQHLWEGFHARFVTYLCDALNDVLPESYVAELGEHFHLMELSGRAAKQVLPDVAAIEGDWRSSQGGARQTSSRGTLTLEPVTIPLPKLRKEVRDVWIDYCALVSRAERRPDCEVYTWTVRDRMPAIPIPLAPPDEDVVVDLGAVFSTAYTRGRYARLIDYTTPPSALRKPDDRAWAKTMARRLHR